MPLLNGVRVLVTRAQGQGSRLAELLAAEAATPILIPTIEIAPPASWCALDAALTSLRSYDWVLFTSANGVNAFAERARTLKLAQRPRHIAVVGVATARAVEASLGQHADLVPESFAAEALARALEPLAPGSSMLLVRAAVASDLLPDRLAAAGAAVTVAQAYRNVIPADSPAQLRELFASMPPDAITFTSGSTARNLRLLLDASGTPLPPSAALASIGPITSAEMRELQMEPSIEAGESTISGLVEALKMLFATRRPRSL